MVLIFNSASGKIESLPFDIKHRRILSYHYDLNKDNNRTLIQKNLVEAIKNQIISLENNNIEYEVHLVNKDDNSIINSSITSISLTPISKHHFLELAKLEEFGIRRERKYEKKPSFDYENHYEHDSELARYIGGIIIEHEEDKRNEGSVFHQEPRSPFRHFLNRDKYFTGVCNYIKDTAILSKL